jgi:omega-6 fatty acid desaturase (delta-12 desaturase)
LKKTTIITNPDISKTSTDLSWRAAVSPYFHPNLWRSVWQLTDTIVPFVLTVYLMYTNLSSNLWLTIVLAPLAAGFQIRLFIFFHDCCHGAFFSSRKLNDLVGFICGAICFTPYEDWRHLHVLHHATSGNLDRRAEDQCQPVRLKKYIQDGYGLLILTIPEYLELSPLAQFLYRVYRHPLFLCVLIPPFQFLIFQRFPASIGGKRERRSVLFTNLTLLGISLLMGFTVGWGAYFVVTLLILTPAAIIGVWLFYIQHQFEYAYWKPQPDWKYELAAMAGSSYYKLPRLLQWFSGNIGFHHIHHLSPRIPNYYLSKCHASHVFFQEVNVITLRSGFRSLKLGLWDEAQQKMISFKGLKTL